MEKKKLLAIGEALIDFAPQQSGCPIKQVKEFSPNVGGAPANVCGAFTRLGGESQMITQLGNDPFGDKIADEFEAFGIGADYVKRTDEANTSLAFVALEENGNREFSFFRKPGADMLMTEDDIKREWFDDAYALHFCSVSLGDFPMKGAHRKAIEYAGEAGAIISFDPNLRFPLWSDLKALKDTVLEFMPLSDIVKISDEEVEFITGKASIEEALPMLLTGRTKLVIYTKGSDGASAYTKQARGDDAGCRVRAVDTTGAGDAFIGSFIYQLYSDNIGPDELALLSDGSIAGYLRFSNIYCSRSVLKQGAIASYPTAEEMADI